MNFEMLENSFSSESIINSKLVAYELKQLTFNLA
jgi:hypothetical protein